MTIVRVFKNSQSIAARHAREKQIGNLYDVYIDIIREIDAMALQRKFATPEDIKPWHRREFVKRVLALK